MRHYTYIVKFANNSGTEEVSAGDFYSAAILACAARIKKGLHRQIEKITEKETGHHTVGEVFVSTTINNIHE